MSTALKIKGSFFTFRDDKYHKINDKDFPLTYKIIAENQKRIKEGLKEFYIYKTEFQPYIDELVKQDYPYEGINIYGSDQTTVAIQIIRMQ